MLPDQVLQDGWKIQFLLLDQLFLFRALLAQMHLVLMAVDDVGKMHGGLGRAGLAFHVGLLRERRPAMASVANPGLDRGMAREDEIGMAGVLDSVPSFSWPSAGVQHSS